MGVAAWLWVIGASCLAAELFARLPFEPVVSRMAKCGARAGRIVSSRRISDHWKEKIMPRYAARMGRDTLTLTFYFALLALLVGGVLLAAEAIAPDAARLLTSAAGLAASFLVAVVYYLVRRRFVRA